MLTLQLAEWSKSNGLRTSHYKTMEQRGLLLIAGINAEYRHLETESQNIKH